MFDFLIKHQDRLINFKKTHDLFFEIKDDNYKVFIQKVTNGGFFLSQSLMIYPHMNDMEYPGIKTVNDCLQLEFGSFFEGLVSFGQDIFGNQFCFDTINLEVVFFNIEDGTKTYMAESFKGWIDCFMKDYDYYSGYSYSNDWQSNHKLDFNERLCPKKPFTIGGDYNVTNFYASVYPAFLKLNAALAKQLHDLPDGTPIQFKILPPDK